MTHSKIVTERRMREVESAMRVLDAFWDEIVSEDARFWNDEEKYAARDGRPDTAGLMDDGLTMLRIAIGRVEEARKG